MYLVFDYVPKSFSVILPKPLLRSWEGRARNVAALRILLPVNWLEKLQ